MKQVPVWEREVQGGADEWRGGWNGEENLGVEEGNAGGDQISHQMPLERASLWTWELSQTRQGWMPDRRWTDST